MQLYSDIGEIVTFYSYKGGTGRTMALANTGCILARRCEEYKRSVLMIDWDLEAPGLHSFFRGEIAEAPDGGVPDVDMRKGVIDYFMEFRDGFTNGNAPSSISIDPYILRTKIPGLYLMTAGRLDAEYAKNVNTFNWEELYQKDTSVFRQFAETLKKRFAFVLIDSRTGETDVSGICTMLLPQRLVAVFTPNRQSIDGVTRVVDESLRYRRAADDSECPIPLLVYPLPSRIETAEPELRDHWRFGNKRVAANDTSVVNTSEGEDGRNESDEWKTCGGFQPEFERVFSCGYGLVECSLRDYFDDIQIQHVPRFSYGEDIAVRMSGSADRLSLSRSYEKFCDRLTSNVPPWENDTLQSVIAKLRFEAMESLERGDFATASALSQRLVKISMIDSDDDEPGQSGQLADALSIAIEAAVPMGALERAIADAKEALTLAETSAQRVKILRQLENLALWSGNYNQASEWAGDRFELLVANGELSDELKAVFIDAETAKNQALREVKSVDDLVHVFGSKTGNRDFLIKLNEQFQEEYKKRSMTGLMVDGVVVDDVRLKLARADFELSIGEWERAGELAAEVVDTCRGRQMADFVKHAAEGRRILGCVCIERGEKIQAQEYFANAVSEQSRILGPVHPQLGATLMDQGRGLLRFGDAVPAYQVLSKSFSILCDTRRRGDCLAMLARAAIKADLAEGIRLPTGKTDFEAPFLQFRSLGGQPGSGIVREARQLLENTPRCKTEKVLQELIRLLEA